MLDGYKWHSKEVDFLAIINSTIAKAPTSAERFRLSKMNGKLIMRFGLPQGLSISPLLCVHYLGSIATTMKPEVVMYADDGVLLWKEKKECDFNQWKTDLRMGGLKVSDEKTKEMNPERVEFLGCIVNLKEG